MSMSVVNVLKSRKALKKKSCTVCVDNLTMTAGKFLVKVVIAKLA